MGTRVVNGNTFTENGWPLVDQAGCTWITIPGAAVTIQVQTGLPATALGAWEADWNAYVEPLEDATTGCWTEGNSVLGQPGRNNGSNHLGGTAVDSDWEKHPMGPHAPDDPRAGFTVAQVNTLREMIDFYTFTARDGTVIQIVWWANDWDTPHDSMHSQMGYDTYKYRDEVAEWCRTHIRPDGFSTFRRGAAPATPPAAQVLASATGLSLARANEILPTVVSGLQAAQCVNVNRIAMWLAQCGEESAGFSTTEEFASGAEYEGRCSDLGNCSPGDGVKYKGRTWIQITGKAHYREFSAWAASKGFISSATQFVDDPSSLGDLRWAGIGAAWYWTVSRPDINALSDAGDVVTVTHRINGGEHGLADRQNRYARARALGDQLLQLLNGDDDMTPDQEAKLDRCLFLMEQQTGIRRPSLSAFRWPGEGDVNTCGGFAWSADGSVHVQLVEKLAVEYGDPNSVAMLVAVAACAGDAKFPDRQTDAALAARILAKVPADAKAAGTAQIKAWLDAEAAK